MINRKSLSEQIFEHVKSRIISLKYPKGFRLKESTVAKEFGVSNIPVREAFKLLKVHGFINLIPNKGAEVIDLKDKTLCRNIYETRIMIECFCIEHTIKNLNDEIIKKFEDCLDQIKNSYMKKKYVIALFDFGFHRIIVESAKNYYILNIYDNIHYMAPSVYESLKDIDKNFSLKSYKEHKELLDSILSKNKRKAKIILRKHLASKIVHGE